MELRETISQRYSQVKEFVSDLDLRNETIIPALAVLACVGSAELIVANSAEAKGKPIKISTLDTSSPEYLSAKGKLESDPMRTTPWAGNQGSGIGPKIKQDYPTICAGATTQDGDPVRTWDYSKGKVSFDYSPKTAKYCDLMGTSTQKIRVQIGKAGKRKAGKFKNTGLVFEHSDNSDEQLPYYGLNSLLIDGKLKPDKDLCTGKNRKRTLVRLAVDSKWTPNLAQTFQNTLYDPDGDGQGVELNVAAKKTSYTAPRFACVPKSQRKTRDYIRGQ